MGAATPILGTRDQARALDALTPTPISRSCGRIRTRHVLAPRPIFPSAAKARVRRTGAPRPILRSCGKTCNRSMIRLTDHPGFAFTVPWVRSHGSLASFSRFRGSGHPAWVRSMISALPESLPAERSGGDAASSHPWRLGERRASRLRPLGGRPSRTRSLGPGESCNRFAKEAHSDAIDRSEASHTTQQTQANPPHFSGRWGDKANGGGDSRSRSSGFFIRPWVRSDQPSPTALVGAWVGRSPGRLAWTCAVEAEPARDETRPHDRHRFGRLCRGS
jgi:hypothetical protein